MNNQYISATEFGKLAGIAKGSAIKVAETAGIRIQHLPGMPVRYNREDVEALVARSFGVAKPDPQACRPLRGRPRAVTGV